MILDRLPDVRSLPPNEKWMLAEELWDELVPLEDAGRDDAIMSVISERMAQYRVDPSTATDWPRLQEKLAMIKQCLRS